jgi:hypothetical protein
MAPTTVARDALMLSEFLAAVTSPGTNLIGEGSEGEKPTQEDDPRMGGQRRRQLTSNKPSSN